MTKYNRDDRLPLKTDQNCWRTVRADRAAVVVDACDYYRIIRSAMLKAKHRILLIGWDFDPRIPLDRTSEDHGDETLGEFLLALAKSKPDLPINILKWDIGALKMLGRGSAMIHLARWAMSKAITFKFDHAHPPGCSHHQKIVVIDDSLAVCGGIDMTADRWDTPSHIEGDERRVRPGGQAFGPWHDATMIVDGEAARALGELGRDRWHRAAGEMLPTDTVADDHDIWPDDLICDFEQVDLGIARTRAAYKEWPEVREIEALYLDMIASAKRFIYAENQYFTSRKIAEAIAKRMKESDPPEIVLISPVTADGWLEQKAMDAARVRLCQGIGAIDTNNRFRIFNPVTTGGTPIYVHAKIMIVDDRVLRIGSSNMNNRSLGLDSECDLFLDTSTADDKPRQGIIALRTRLMAEHLDVAAEDVARVFEETGSLLETISALQSPGKTLKLLEFEEPGDVETFIADNEILDPEHPDAFFESLDNRGLWTKWRARLGRHKPPAQ
jgi:phosphatidylserine/phosphatidylglycerophosphate/cardiolipin synthase-like enzyme